MKRKSCFILLTAVLLMMLSVIPVSAKTSIVPGVAVNEAKGSKDWNIGMGLGIYGKTKWKSGTYSAELLLPADLLVKNNMINIEGQLDLQDATVDEHKADPYLGTATSSTIVLSVDKSGKIKKTRHSNMKGKDISFGSASVDVKKVSSGKYYLVTIKDMPFDNTYFPRDTQEWQPKNAKSIPTNKNLRLNSKFNVGSWGKINKAVKDCVYLVSFSVNTGVKTMKLNFTGNFLDFYAWGNKAGKEFQVTRKIARVSY